MYSSKCQVPFELRLRGTQLHKHENLSTAALLTNFQTILVDTIADSPIVHSHMHEQHRRSCETRNDQQFLDKEETK